MSDPGRKPPRKTGDVDIIERLSATEAQLRVRALRRLTRWPDCRAEVIARLEELLDDRSIAIITPPNHLYYGEVRLVAAEAVAAARAKMGDPRIVEIKNAPRPLTLERMAPYCEGHDDLRRVRAIRRYEALLDRGCLPIEDRAFDPADYA